MDIPAGPTWRRAVAEQRTLRPLLRSLGATVYDHGFLPTPRVGVPVCGAIHDARDADGEGRWPRWLARSVLRRSLRRAASVVTVSEWTAQRLRALAPGCDPVVVRNGVDDREPGAPPADLPARGYVLHVGHLEARKNLGVLIRALAHITAQDRPELWLLGADAGEGSRLRALAEGLSVHEHVRFLGPKSDAELPAYYHDARLVVVPSRYEGFGLPALEAQVHGTRVAVPTRARCQRSQATARCCPRRPGVGRGDVRAARRNLARVRARAAAAAAWVGRRPRGGSSPARSAHRALMP